MAEHKARWAEVAIIYEGKNITKDIAPYLLSFTYTDNAADKADDISFNLEDRDRLWINDWFPTKGDKVIVSIVVHEWEAPDKTESLPCGTFEVDEISCSGAPNTVTIKAISTLISKPMRQEKHTQAWEDVRLSAIAGDFANKNGLKLFWDCSEDPYFERRDQAEKSDLDFLAELGRDYGIKTKVTDTQLVLYSAEEYEVKESVAELKFGDKKLLSWSFTSKSAGTYKAARLQYHDPVKNENIDVTEESEDDIEGTGRTLEFNQKADSIADAKKIAKEKLKKANKKEISGNINLMGDLRFVGGSNIKISGFGMFDGDYVIEKATHTISGNYTTKLDLSMGEEAKKELRKKKKSKSNSGRQLFYEGDNIHISGKAKLI